MSKRKDKKWVRHMNCLHPDVIRVYGESFKQAHRRDHATSRFTHKLRSRKVVTLA